MTDCSQIEVPAVHKVFSESISTLLHHGHTKRACEKRMRSDIKVVNSTIKNLQAYSTARATLNNAILFSTLTLSRKELSSF